MSNPLHDLFPGIKKQIQIFGIVNCTPDSFSDGGQFFDPAKARQRIRALFLAGADAVDIGAESTRPGAQSISTEEEWQRLAPVLRGLKAELRHDLPHHPLTLSIDTKKPVIAERALGLGVDIINDVGGGREKGMFSFVASAKCPYVLMHSRGDSSTMMMNTNYGENFLEGFLTEVKVMIEAAVLGGVAQELIILDPGIGFAKTKEQSCCVLQNLDRLQIFDLPILFGPSRKSFLKSDSDNEPNAYSNDMLDDLTLAACVLAAKAGARFLRVHEPERIALALRWVNAVMQVNGSMA